MSKRPALYHAHPYRAKHFRACVRLQSKAKNFIRRPSLGLKVGAGSGPLVRDSGEADPNTNLPHLLGDCLTCFRPDYEDECLEKQVRLLATSKEGGTYLFVIMHAKDSLPGSQTDLSLLGAE
jgi:hypothetical protein